MDKLWNAVLITSQEDPCSSGEIHERKDVLQCKTHSNHVEMLKKRVFAKDLEHKKNPRIKVQQWETVFV